MDAFVADLKKIIPEATGMFGDIPFDHYHFLIMDQGMGGLEHASSMAVYTRENFYEKEGSERNKGWMNFITHEFFHLYNVKSIRPEALWPIDYARENYTEQLWISEGINCVLRIPGHEPGRIADPRRCVGIPFPHRENLRKHTG